LLPLISYEDNYFAAAPHLLTWATKPRLEELLATTEESPVRAYETYRSNYLVRRALQYLEKALPGKVHQNLFYDFPDSQHRCELDGLLLFDDYVFVVEGKSGVANPASRRGGLKSIATDVKKLIADPAEQALRAREFIDSNAKPIFRLQNGELIAIDKSRTRHVIPICVTMDDVGIFSADMARLASLESMQSVEPVWTVFICDLRVITEILDSPFLFLHYLSWRLPLLKNARISGGKDEVNWVGIYLCEGPEPLNAPDGFELDFSSYTTSFDNYFLYQQGHKSKKEDKPNFALPFAVAKLLDQLRILGGHGFSEVGTTILGLGHRIWNRLARKLTNTTFHSESTIQAGDVVIAVVWGQKIGHCNTRAADLSRIEGKKAVVLNIALDSNSVIEWSIKHSSKAG